MTIQDINVKSGFYLRHCGDGFCLSQRQDGVQVDIAYKTTLTKLVAYLKKWDCGIIL